MLSTVDIAPSAAAAAALPVSIVRVREVSNGVTVSRLVSGDYAIAAHDGDRRVIVTATAEELREFARGLAGLLR